LVIQVHSAQFTVDIGHLSKQDPYIKVRIGLHKEKTTSKTRAGKSATWNETLTFTKLDRVEGTDHTVYITARDKNILKNNTIGKASIPLSNLLSLQGQRGIDLFDPKDHTKLTGHVQITVMGGEAFAHSGLTSGHDKSLTTGHTGHGTHGGHDGKAAAAALGGAALAEHEHNRPGFHPIATGGAALGGAALAEHEHKHGHNTTGVAPGAVGTGAVGSGTGVGYGAATGGPAGAYGTGAGAGTTGSLGGGTGTY